MIGFAIFLVSCMAVAVQIDVFNAFVVNQFIDKWIAVLWLFQFTIFIMFCIWAIFFSDGCLEILTVRVICHHG